MKQVEKVGIRIDHVRRPREYEGIGGVFRCALGRVPSDGEIGGLQLERDADLGQVGLPKLGHRLLSGVVRESQFQPAGVASLFQQAGRLIQVFDVARRFGVMAPQTGGYGAMGQRSFAKHGVGDD